MTHLANADMRKDQKTLNQLALFDTIVSAYSVAKTIANSAGILAWQETHKDWVRPGIMLYGVSPFADNDGSVFDLQPVMSLHSRLLAVKQINTNETVGYGGQWQCKKPTLLGVIAAGYGDGYPRQAVAGTPVLVNNVRVPIIGRVSMDMITVDLQECPNAVAGDPVILWGVGLPVEEIAGYTDTIPYTLLCGITQRVQIIENECVDQSASKLLSTDSSSCA
jgi:alanine racemase